jgi:hypothetical protein
MNKTTKLEVLKKNKNEFLHEMELLNKKDELECAVHIFLHTKN